MTDTTLTLIEEQAYKLAEAAIALDRARSQADDAAVMLAALDNNLEVWTAFTVAVALPGSGLEAGVRDNLMRLRNFIAEQTLRINGAVRDATMDTLININLQISEGLLEGQKRAGA
ncbi:flagellar biosynthesis regulator FlaF [Magnetospirillum sp. UT-4]|uniref:flagellar biosynthesis regulator FlaF n=1 Tax=Magnetospirillum sp. UT-4 TaxID=2681467 RepID=UPI00138241E4|nr:flagellar biosynthesis regulator FlaF [Magnetospirillum sp. UT-4]CAA7618491.1 conserved hypothetical protein [Magnetospirillum sp. UT-4]